MKILNISFRQVAIEPITCRVYSNTIATSLIAIYLFFLHEMQYILLIGLFFYYNNLTNVKKN